MFKVIELKCQSQDLKQGTQHFSVQAIPYSPQQLLLLKFLSFENMMFVKLYLFQFYVLLVNNEVEFCFTSSFFSSVYWLFIFLLDCLPSYYYM